MQNNLANLSISKCNCSLGRDGDGDVEGEDEDDGVLGDDIIQYAPHQLPPAETRNNLGSNEVSLSNLITEPANTARRDGRIFWSHHISGLR